MSQANYMKIKLTKSFPHYHQTGQMDCGPTCLRIIAKHYGKSIRAQTLRKIAETNKIGTSLSSISNAAERIGFKTMGVKIGIEKLKNEAPMPCIVFWNQNHYPLWN